MSETLWSKIYTIRNEFFRDVGRAPRCIGMPSALWDKMWQEKESLYGYGAEFGCTLNELMGKGSRRKVGNICGMSVYFTDEAEQ